LSRQGPPWAKKGDVGTQAGDWRTNAHPRLPRIARCPACCPRYTVQNAVRYAVRYAVQHAVRYAAFGTRFGMPHSHVMFVVRLERSVSRWLFHCRLVDLGVCGSRVASTRRLRWHTLQTCAISASGCHPLDDKGVVCIVGDEGRDDVDCFGDGPRGTESPVGVGHALQGVLQDAALELKPMVPRGCSASVRECSRPEHQTEIMDSAVAPHDRADGFFAHLER